MTTSALGRVAVIGATRGLGRGVAIALAKQGWSVTAIGRTAGPLAELGIHGIEPRVGDATDATLAREMMSEGLDAFVLVAGAQPLLAPIASYDWEAFRRPFEVDVRAAFTWLQAALLAETPPSRAIVFSSGAALHGSPLSGGYAGAKHTQRFLCRYSQQEAKGRDLALRVQCVLPQLNPNTTLGQAAIQAYADKAGVSPEAFVAKRFGDSPLDPAKAGAAIVELLGTDTHAASDELLLTGGGVRSLK